MTSVEAACLVTPFPLTGVIDAIDHLRLPLVSDRALRSLQCMAAQLPACLSNRLYFECRLGADPQVDIVMCVDSRNRDVLRRHAGLALPDRLRAHSAWNGVIQLFDWWAGCRAPSSRAVGEVWLELDAVPDNERRPVPGVFLAFPRGTAPSDIRSATLAGFELLRGEPFSGEIVSAVSHAIESVHEPARVAYAGLMCSRDLDTIRLCIANLKRHRVLPYLRDVGWPGHVAELAGAVQAVGCASVPDPLASVALLHVDVAAQVGPRIGMEICFDRAHQRRARTREHDLLDRLCVLGLSTTDKRDALLAWPGYSLTRFPHESSESLVVRRVNGIKLVHVPARALEVKAYATVFHAVRSTLGAAS